MRTLIQDLSYALRRLLKAPTFSLLVILTLAVGISANTAVFSIIHGIVFQPLPFPDAERLVRICAVHERVAGYCVASPPDLEDWSSQAQTFDGFGLARGSAMVLKQDQRSEGVSATLVSPSYLELFGVKPLLGRQFRPDDLEQHVVILGHGIWQSRFGGDPNFLGQAVTLDDESYTVVGILPEGVEIPELESTQLWVPLPFDPQDPEYRPWRGFQAVGRLEAGTSLARGRQELSQLAEELARILPETNEGWGVTAVALRDRVVGPIRSTLWIFWGAVLCVLLIACTNVAGMVLARSLGRHREFAVRASLGAGRGRLIRQLFTESLVLALVGGALGALLAWWAVQLFVGLAPPDIPRLEEVKVEMVALGFTILISLLSSLLFGLFPARRAVRLDLMESLRTGVQAPSGRSIFGVRGLLVIAEVALALVLLIGAGLLIRSFVEGARWTGGFETENLSLFWLLPSENKYTEKAQLADLYQRVVEELESIPGVIGVGTTSAGPLFGGREAEEFRLEDSSREPLVARWFDLDAHYFRMLGLPLRQGRFFTAQDRAGAPRVALVNETLARRIAPDGQVVGQLLERGGDTPVSMEIVGVVADMPPLPPQKEVEPEIYWPNQQVPRWATYLVVRTDSDPDAMVKALVARIESIDPDMGIRHRGSFTEQLDRHLIQPRFAMAALSLFALVALVLAISGTYSVISHNVAARTREMGLRMSLGATRGEILQLVVRQALQLVGLGVGLGLVGAVLLTRFLSGMLYQVTATNPVTFLTMAGVLVLAALLASYLPARRASRVDPIIAIRYE